MLHLKIQTIWLGYDPTKFCPFLLKMRYIVILFLISMLFSCQKSEIEQATIKPIYSADTFKIESKGKLLDLEDYILVSDLNRKGNLLFLNNGFDHSVDEIDLNRLEFVKSYPFDIEGPKGVGEYVYFLTLVDDKSIFFKSHNQSVVLDISGNLIKRIDWVNAIDSKDSIFGKIPEIEIAISSEHLKVYGLSFDRKERLVFLDVLSVQDNRVKRFDIDTERSYRDFVLAVEDPAAYSYLDPVVYLSNENDLVIVSHQFSNELFLFDANGQFVRKVNYEPKLTPKRARNPKGNTLATSEELSEAYQSLLEQVRFGPPVWDSVGKRYFRLSAKRAFSEHREVNAFLPEQTDIKIYLTVFDSGFNLVSELLIPELDHETRKYFAKDGKLWVFRNLSDELGFIVVELL